MNGSIMFTCCMHCRDFLRLVTFRVTAALAFGLPVHALGMQDALQVVHKVAAFFEVSKCRTACDYPSWAASYNSAFMQDALQVDGQPQLTCCYHFASVSSGWQPYRSRMGTAQDALVTAVGEHL